MLLVEQHIIKSNDQYFKTCDDLCFKTKNLYNKCLYEIRQEYIHNHNNILYNLYYLMKDTIEYKSIPRKVSSAVILDIQHNFKSFFKANKDYNINPHKYNSKPRLPFYLDKINGRFITTYNSQAISKKVFKKTNKIKLSQIDIEFKTKIIDFNIINCVRIVPRNGYYIIEVIYAIKEKEILIDNNRYLSIDLGINNLATITSNIKDIKPVIINGKPLKSINQYYNKKNSDLKSVLKLRNNKFNSNNLNLLNLKRKNKIDNYLHKASKLIIKQCIDNNINTLIIGKNDSWKQESEMSKKNNQNFINIPHSRFIQMLQYKCEIQGINVKVNEESYTSKASFLNLDHIPVYKRGNDTKYEFSGYRISRGLYKIKNSNTTINADVNGSYNILRKAIPKVFADGIEGIEVCPEIIKISKN